MTPEKIKKNAEKAASSTADAAVLAAKAAFRANPDKAVYAEAIAAANATYDAAIAQIRTDYNRMLDDESPMHDRPF